MYPKLLELGPITLHSYGLMMAIAFITVLLLIQRDAARSGIDPKILSDATFWSLLIGIVGARLLHIIMFPHLYAWNDPIGWVALWKGGLVFQGGPPLVIVFLYVYFRQKGLDPWRTGDVGLPYLALGHAIGRIGCFLNGCCYGQTTDAVCAVSFPRIPADLGEAPAGSPPYIDHLAGHLIEDNALWSLPVHPTQLYSAAALLALFGTLLYLRKVWNPFPGFTLPLYLMLYSGGRFVIEGLRGDHNPTRFGILSDQQVICIATILVGAVLFVVLKRRHRHLEARKGAQ